MLESSARYSILNMHVEPPLTHNEVNVRATFQVSDGA